MAFYGVQYALTASAVSLTTALGYSRTFRTKELTIRNATGAANAIYLGPSTVTNVPANAFVQLAAGQAFSFMSIYGHAVNTDEVYIVGVVNAANIAFITVVE